MDNYKFVQFMHFDKYVINTQLAVDIQTKQYYVLMILCANNLHLFVSGVWFKLHQISQLHFKRIEGC